MNLADMFGKMQEMQSNMIKLKEQLNDVTVEAEVGGGMVRVVATANRQLKSIHLDPEVLKDKEMAEDLILAAVNKALEKGDEKGREEMQRITAQMLPNLPNIPGMDLSKLGL